MLKSTFYKIHLVWLVLYFASCASAQLPEQMPINPVPFSISSSRETKSFDAKAPFKNLPIENIGPTIMGGRVVDLEVDPNDANHFYVAFASGGLWETKNNGQSFLPVFETESTLTIGDFAIHWPSNTIYIGTGEVNSSRSSYAGLGVFKSTNNGKTWKNIGLPESHHIGKIIIDNQDPDKLWVAVLGHLYSPNKERGIYTTQDGGNNWQHTLFINENTGCVDLIIDANNPKILYASAWERTRRAWNFWEAGESSGVYKSTDSGKTWTLITNRASGFPSGKNCGRIGLALYSNGGTDVLYALVDNQGKDTSYKEPKGLNRKDFKTMSKQSFLAIQDSILKEFLENNGFEAQYTAKRIKAMVSADSLKTIDLYNYLSDANTDLFESKLIGLELYKSTDGGQHWIRTHEQSLNGVAYTYGYYFGLIRVSPKDPNELYIAGVPLLHSVDGGKLWEFAGGDNVHVDHHALWINPNNTNHIINGNDGGVVISYDKGKNWTRCNHPPLGQFYSVYADNKINYSVYGGLQDNGVWKGSPYYSGSKSWQMYGQYPYKMVMGGDGMQVAVDDKEDLIYTGYQFGHYFRIDNKTSKQKSIMPKHTLGEKPLRFNWQSPLWLSVHNADIVYFGSNKVHRSLNKGDNWQTISADLTKGEVAGDVSFGTISSLHESNKHFGWLLAGTDDGQIHITKNGGETWAKISDKLPQKLWVSRVRFSLHNDQTLYVCLNGYRWDNFESHFYKSTNLGQTWIKINGLPNQPINSFAEDLNDKGILYVATDNGLYLTTDGGNVFFPHPNSMPKVPVHDVFAHNSGYLFIGTHGRSLYKLETAPIGEYNAIKDSSVYILAIEDIRHSKGWGEQQFDFSYYTPKMEQLFYVSQKNADSAQVRILTEDEVALNQWNSFIAAGFNVLEYDFTIQNQAYLESNKELIKKADNQQYYLLPGTYYLEVKYGKNTRRKQFIVNDKKKN
jgi:photosystem II stability/assembly factor-like uncharacterized protein